MCILRKATLVACLVGALIAPRSFASSFEVDFAFVNRPIFGVFAFDSVSDGIRGARALHMTSNSLAEGGSGYHFSSNQFTFRKGAVAKIDFAAYRQAPSGSLYHLLTIISDIGIYDMACRDIDRNGDFGFGCGGDPFEFFSAPGLRLEQPRPVPIPSPAPWSLVVSGVVSLIGLKRVKPRRCARMAHPPAVSSKTPPHRMMRRRWRRRARVA